MTSINSDGFFQIEEILEKKFDPKTKKFLYKIKWQDYSYDDCTWEPEENLILVPKMLKEFEEKSNKNKTDKHIDKVSRTVKKAKKNISNDVEISKIHGKIGTDTPKKIIGLKKEDDELLCLVEWESSQKNKKLNSIVKHSILREKYPLLLLSFYEERIVFKK